MQIDDMNQLLFEQIKAISDKDLKDNDLGQEVERSKAMALLASQYLQGEVVKMRREVASQKVISYQRRNEEFR